MPKAPHPVVSQLEAAARAAGKDNGTLGYAMGTSRRQVNEWFSGKSGITIRMAERLAKFLGKEICIKDENPAAIQLLEELTEALAERPIDPERVQRWHKRAKVFLRAGDVQ